MAKRDKGTVRRRRMPPNLPRMAGCPGPVCREVSKRAIDAIAHILRTGKPVDDERAKDADEQEVLDRRLLSP